MMITMVYVRVRDGDLLEQSNFDAALRKVGGEPQTL